MQQGSRFVLSNAAALGALLLASPAFAHIDLIDPPARAHGTAASGDTDVDTNTNQKVGPCGQTVNGRTDRVTTYQPGQTITVQVREETNHDSYIRVALDLEGDDDFIYRQPIQSIPAETQEVAQAAEEAIDNGTLLRVYRENNTQNGFVHNIDVTLPNETCENCTLQVIQLMYDTGQVYYYQCADIALRAEGGETPPDSADAGAAGSANAGNAGAAGAAGSGGAGGSGTTGPVGTGGSAGPSGTGGTGNTSSTGGTGSSAAGTGSTPVGAAGAGAPIVDNADDSDDGGCTITTHSNDGSASTGLVGLLALGLGMVIRRRR